MTHGFWVSDAPNIVMTRRQCRAARNHLGFTAAFLAKKSGLGTRTIEGFERGEHDLRVGSRKMLIDCFRSLGVTFDIVDGQEIVTMPGRGYDTVPTVKPLLPEGEAP